MAASRNGVEMDDEMVRWPTGRLLSAAARRVERDWDAHLDTWQLSHASLPILFLLARSDHSQRELATAMGVTEQTMSRVLARMERCGYVTRTPHATDRRRHVVALLPGGAESLAAAIVPGQSEALATRGLTPEQVAALRDALLTFLAAADEPSPRGEHTPGTGLG